MKQITSEQIKNAFDTLAPDVSRALSQLKINDLASTIGKKNNLHVDQIGSLSGLVSLKIIGLLSATEFPDVVREELHISDEQMIRVVDDVNTLIFKVLREKVIARAQIVVEEDADEESDTIEVAIPVVEKPIAVAPADLPVKEEEKIAMDEHSILKNSEIELEETPLVIPIIESSHIKSLDREELLKTIEHPPASASSIAMPINTSSNTNVFTPNRAPLPKIEVMPKSATDIPKVQTIIAPPIKVTQKIEPAEIPLPQAPSAKTQAPQTPIAPTISQGLVSDKLQSTFKLPQQESNYSLPKVGNSPSVQTSTDPYREAL